jgi:ketosteroid isomerase-like protein
LIVSTARTGDSAGLFFLRDQQRNSCVTTPMNNSFWRAAAWAVLLVSGLLACAKAPAADTERVALEAAIHRWVTAVNAHDVATLATTMTDDIELLDGNAAVTGRDAAIRALREVVARGRLIATSREITMDNDVAWHVVWFAQTQKDGVVQTRGQALEIWKHVNGEWKLHRQMAAGLMSPVDSLTRPSTSEPVLDRPAIAH